MAPIYSLNAEWPENFNLRLYRVSVENDKEKHSKMRSACIYFYSLKYFPIFP